MCTQASGDLAWIQLHLQISHESRREGVGPAHHFIRRAMVHDVQSGNKIGKSGVKFGLSQAERTN